MPEKSSVRVDRHHEPPMKKYQQVNADMKQISKASSRSSSSSSRCNCNPEKVKVVYVLWGSICCTVIIGALFAVPIVVTVVLSKTTTTARTESTTILVNASSTSSSSVASTSSTVLTSTNSASSSSLTSTLSTVTNLATTATTSVCPIMTCTFEPVIGYMATNYGAEKLNINCTQTLTSMFAQIVVQKTVNATFAKQYNLFWNDTTNQTHTETSNEIIYTWSLVPGQVIQDIGFPYFIEAQYNLYGINQTTTFDTYSISLTSICGTTISANGTF